MKKERMSVADIASKNGMTIKELATRCGIPSKHLQLVASGKVRMLGKDLILLSEVTGIAPEDISF